MRQGLHIPVCGMITGILHHPKSFVHSLRADRRWATVVRGCVDLSGRCGLDIHAGNLQPGSRGKLSPMRFMLQEAASSASFTTSVEPLILAHGYSEDWLSLCLDSQRLRLEGTSSAMFLEVPATFFRRQSRTRIKPFLCTTTQHVGQRKPVLTVLNYTTPTAIYQFSISRVTATNGRTNGASLWRIQCDLL